MDDIQLKALVHRVKKGDSEAFGVLYSTLSEDAYRFALYYLHDSDDAADAVQNTALKAWKNIRSLNKAESFRSWFFTIEANECKRTLQYRKRNIPMGEDFPEIPDDSEQEMYLSAEINEILGTLSEEDRLIVLLSVVQGFTSKEISEMVGIKPTSVRSRLSRALHSMRQKLETEG